MATLVSVIVSCEVPLATLRPALAMLARHTRGPWELIATGASGEAVTYLAGVADAASFPATILAAAGLGPALARARGEFVAILEGGTVVADGWLDQWIALAESDPAIGLCGAMSDAARPPQRVADVPVADLAGMRAFAGRWRAEHRGQWFTAGDLSGPGLLVRRAILESLGGLPATGAELIARARGAGVAMAVAHDLFLAGGVGLVAPPRTRVVRIGPAEFARRFGTPDTGRALLGYTLRRDADVVLALVAHARPLRLLEVGTAFGHMTANLAAWSPDPARVFSLGIVRGMDPGGAPEQEVEAPSEAEFGRFADHFGQGHKVTFLRTDSRAFDFGSLAPLDFAFIDGGHDLEPATNDTREAYEALAPGGWLVWHDFASPHPWIRVREAIERLGLPEAVHHATGTEVAFLRKAGPGPDPLAANPLTAATGPVRLVWEGDWRGRHSLGLINRALCLALIARGHDLGLDPGGPAPTSEAEGLPPEPRLEERAGRGPRGGPPQVHLAHRWPPRLDRPPGGRWVFYQPWEFGRLPEAWLPAALAADEVWAYSRAVRDVYLDAGVPADRVHVVPLGVDPDAFRPGLEPLPLPHGPDLRFLFVGGTIWRKGIDLVLEAFSRAFAPSDGVGLVVQDMGTTSFYRGQTAGAAIAALRDRGYPIEYRAESLAPRELARLYAACDAAVQPYRGEGFALPAIEAMACGLPVVVTGEGPSRDYAGAGTAYLVPARRRELAEDRVGEIATLGRPWVWEPDVEALADRLRAVAGDRARARAVGAAASDWVRGRFTWGRAAEAAEVRLHALATPPFLRKGEDA